MKYNNLLKDYLKTELEINFYDKEIENVKVDGCKITYCLVDSRGVIKKDKVDLYHLLEFIYDVAYLRITI